MDKQGRVDSIDVELMRRLLPPEALTALGSWWAGNCRVYQHGSGAHGIVYTPTRWSSISLWPKGLADRSRASNAVVSRAQVVELVSDALAREAWSEALVATYVWGMGMRGTPAGSGPYLLQQILAADGINAALAAGIATLEEEGAVSAYAKLSGAVRGLGPAFFTKFLYFADQALPAVPGPRALILDKVLAGLLRAHAATVGAEMGLDAEGKLAAWSWSDGGWTPHRYETYLSWMQAASDQLAAAGVGWPVGAAPDLLELALFTGVRIA